MAIRRKTENTALAFLDIISCGLGAVILLFLIIKHNEDFGSNQTDNLKAQLASLIEQRQDIREQTEDLRRQNSDAEQAGKTLQDQLIEAQGLLAALSQQNASAKEQNKILEETVEEIEQAEPTETVEVKGAGQANYIIGMQVEGSHIAVLLDHSTSMTYPTLDQAIVAKFDSDAQRRNAPKWQRTVRISKWLLANMPAQSKFAVIGFNNNAGMLSPGNAWSSAGAQADLNATVQNITGLAPTGGTNLESAVRMALNLNPRPTDIYIVTDGLPTQGSASCARRQSITPKCRISLLSNVSNHLNRTFPGGRVPINTILLPMTGDPDALPQFWGWANATKGVVLSPSEKWP